jgi:hypothetical protein
VALVGKGVTASVAQHVRVGLEFEAGGSGDALDHPGKAGGRESGAALADEDEGATPSSPAGAGAGLHLVGCDMPADEVRREWAHGTGA